MGIDAPLYQQTTNDANNQFLRKLSIYAKGSLGKANYRFILSNPMVVNATTGAVHPINTNADFSFKPAKLQTSAYVNYNFFDTENNLLPYMTGNYLGTKKVFNIGYGFQHQNDAMWRWNDVTFKDTVYRDMLNKCRCNV